MYKCNTHKGYSLVEMLVAVSILMLAVVGPITIAAKGLQNARFAKEQNIGFFLAQEGIEAIVKLRNDGALRYYDGSDADSWTWSDAITTAGCSGSVPCGVDINNNFQLFTCSSATCDVYLGTSGRARYSHDSGASSTSYSRELYLDRSGNTVHVRSVVSWGAGDRQVTLESFISDIYGIQE